MSSLPRRAGIGRDVISIVAMLATLAAAYGIDRLTKQLNLVIKTTLSIHPSLVMWAILVTQVLFATTIVLLAWFTLKRGELGRITPAVFIATGLLILLTATPTFWTSWANVPGDWFIRELFAKGPLYNLSPAGRLAEAAAFILVIGVLRVLLRPSRS